MSESTEIEDSGNATPRAPGDPSGAGCSVRRLVRCSTPLCGGVAEWVRPNIHCRDKTEHKCTTCFYRNQHNHNCWNQAGGLAYDGTPKWKRTVELSRPATPRMSDSMKDHEHHAFYRSLGFVVCPECGERMEGVEGSTPASGSRTRAAGSKPDASLTSDSARPFADQVKAEIESLNGEIRDVASHGLDWRWEDGTEMPPECGDWYRIGLIKGRNALRDLLAYITAGTQSDSEGAQAGCLELSDGSVYCQHDGKANCYRCDDCPAEADERSGSANADVSREAGEQGATNAK